MGFRRQQESGQSPQYIGIGPLTAHCTQPHNQHITHNQLHITPSQSQSWRGDQQLCRTPVASLLQRRESSEDGLSGCPTRRSIEAQMVCGLFHLHDQGQCRVVTEAAGLTQHCTEQLAGNPRECHTPDVHDSVSVTTCFMFHVFWMP